LIWKTEMVRWFEGVLLFVVQLVSIRLFGASRRCQQSLFARVADDRRMRESAFDPLWLCSNLIGKLLLKPALVPVISREREAAAGSSFAEGRSSAQNRTPFTSAPHFRRPV
jgi:hypothetical protein